VDGAGGDIHDVCRLRDGRYRVFLADATGHGVSVAMRSMVLKAEYDRLKLRAPDPTALLSALNHKIAHDFPELDLMSPAVAIDATPRADGGARVHYANAAANAILHFHEGEAQEIFERSTYLGTSTQLAQGRRGFVIGRGDRLVAFTDGLYEQRDAAGEPFGYERVAEILGNGELPLDAAVNAVVEAVTRHAHPNPVEDDITLIAIEARGLT
jgi:sigma-B regulation protein RsbU (phosphoserine phosphatase)